MWETLTDLAAELNALGPAIVAPEVPQSVVYKPVNFISDSRTVYRAYFPADWHVRMVEDGEEVLSKRYPQVHTALHRFPNGDLVLLAANSRYCPVDVTFRLSCLPRSGTVRRLFENAQIAGTGSRFSDRFAPLATRAYRFAAPPTLKTPVRIEVASTPHPEQMIRESTLTREGRKGRRNIVPNPSFEHATLRDCPDYFIPHGSDIRRRVGTPDADWGPDTTDPVHGNVCLRLRTPASGDNGFMFWLSPKHDAATDYVFSAYLKGERDGMEVQFMMERFGIKKVRVTTEWQRYEYAIKFPPDTPPTQLFLIKTYTEGLTWVDAVQMERGREVTAFEP